jgi:hypothetical protein
MSSTDVSESRSSRPGPGHIAALFDFQFFDAEGAAVGGAPKRHRVLPDREARRIRIVIESAVAEVFGVPRHALGRPSRGKAPIALARQAAMYLAHVSCRLSLTDVGQIFARDRTTVAHACAVIEDRRDDPVFDRALELMEWIVPSLVAWNGIHTA